MKCYNRFDNNYQGNDVFTSLRLTDENGKDWFIDSGASTHVTSYPATMQEVHPYEEDDVVMVGDGAYLPITHIGSATLTSCSGIISLTDVLIYINPCCLCQNCVMIKTVECFLTLTVYMLLT